MIRLKALWGILILSIFQCTAPHQKAEKNASEIYTEYAEAFRLVENDNERIVQILDPATQEVFQSVVLHDSLKSNRIVVISTTHLPFIEALDEINAIVGLSNPDLIYSQAIRNHVESGAVVDVGNDQSLNFERLIELKPDLIFFYDFGPGTANTIKRLEAFGMNVIRIAEFREVTPLGKAEWIRFFGLIFGKEAKAHRIFEDIKNRYQAVKEKSGSFEDRPIVFTGLPWKGEWYQPGGASFQACFFFVSGAHYSWEDDPSTSGIVIDREVVFDKAIDAAFWLHPSNHTRLSEIVQQDERFSHFQSFKDGSVYNNNKRMNDAFGNDYWESGVLNPDLILLDLLSVFHPEIGLDHELIYYQKLD